MKTGYWATGAIGALLVLVSVWQILAAEQGLQVTTLPSTATPLTVIRPETGSNADGPIVLVGHGYAASGLLMRGFALTLARAGYTVVLWDFDGHGSNPQSLSSTERGGSLLHNAEEALAQATARGFGDADRVAIVGHSMGSGVALSFGQEYPGTAATIAVSPVGQPVTPDLPRNLLLMAGSLEAAFVRNAEARLAEAGGPGGDPEAGTARKLIVIPGVEHISILFSPAAHAAARDWLDATFGRQPGATPYADRRIVWYGLGMVGALLLGAALAPLVADPAATERTNRPLWRRLAALVGGALGATLILWLVGQAGLELRAALGVQVGGYLVLWFGLAGLLSMLLLTMRPRLPSGYELLGGLLASAALWLGVGLLAQLVWLPWLLIPRRLMLWPLSALLLLPWFLAAGETVRGARIPGRLGWWVAHSVILAGAMLLALRLSPDLYFLILVLPLFPIVLGLHALAAAPHRGSWPFVLSGALFVSWLLLAVFPLQ